MCTINRDELVAQAGALLEKGLAVVGVTAIEDKLQDEVPEVSDCGCMHGVVVGIAVVFVCCVNVGERG